MKILFDTNIILDVLLDRKPFVHYACYLLSKVERSEIMAFVCATTITTIHYLLKKTLGSDQVYIHINSLLSLFAIAPVNRLVLEKTLKSKFNDFEDAVIHESAIHCGAQYIITRNIKDFKNSKLPVFEPQEFINIIKSLKI
ncbi:PIN domain-containing protein [Desulfonauticus submarinus]